MNCPYCKKNPIHSRQRGSNTPKTCGGKRCMRMHQLNLMKARHKRRMQNRTAKDIDDRRVYIKEYMRLYREDTEYHLGEKYKSKMAKTKKARYQQLKRMGICVNGCGNKSTPGMSKCEQCRIKQRNASRKYRESDRYAEHVAAQAEKEYNITSGDKNETS